MSKHELMQCQQCAYWGRDFEGACDKPDSIDKRSQATGQQMAIYADAADDTDLEFRLMTGPEFGCVLFQPTAHNTR